MIVLNKNLGLLPIYNNITTNIDLTNNSSVDMTVIDFSTEGGIEIIDIKNVIISKNSVFSINTILKTIYNNFSPIQNKKLFLNCLYDSSIENILINIDYTSFPFNNTLLFKINDILSINRYLIITIEFDYVNKIIDPPILILHKLNNSYIRQISKIVKINGYTYSYIFKFNNRNIDIIDNLFVLYYTNKIKISNMFIRGL